MWIITKIGFFSIIQKSWNISTGTLTIRARVRSDLEGLKAYLTDMSDIVESNDSDYKFRVVAKRGAVEAAMAALIADIGYSNFKSEVAATVGYARAAVYSDVWHDLYRLQNGQYEEQPASPTML
jgi:hypothetical protein